ncbi:hypothetical protein IQ07DRAFT_222807 [Pyrenochaeta sp. DS3sAY3a]|nr:hypothetical protein IQ07DRAFT_222807 [Pyrenochaeta sp. DS3sAY3a]
MFCNPQDSADEDIVRSRKNCSSMTKVGLVRRRAVGELWAKSWARTETNVDFCLKRTKHAAPLFTAHGMGAYCMQRLGICAHTARQRGQKNKSTITAYARYSNRVTIALRLRCLRSSSECSLAESVHKCETQTNTKTALPMATAGYLGTKNSARRQHSRAVMCPAHQARWLHPRHGILHGCHLCLLRCLS